MKTVEDYIITIPNFPSEGIMFRDITSVLRDKDGFKLAIDEMEKYVSDMKPDLIAGTESRGFIFGTPLAYNLNKGFVLFRKKGKLPRETIEESYDLEYGSATIEMHKEDIKPGQRIVIIDDLIATGGTLKACINLVERLGGVVAGIVVLIELVDLKGRELLKDYRVESIIKYKGE